LAISMLPHRTRESCISFVGAPTRRTALLMIGAVPFVAASARAADGQWYPLHGDDGSPIQNFRVPAELDPAAAPGIVWKGAETAGVVLYEFFDYNCAYCRKAARDIEQVVASDADLRLGLVNNPVLSLGSVQAAKVQQAVLRLQGPKSAYDFHLRMFAKRGGADGPGALDVARAMGLDAGKIEESADNPIVADVLARQARLSSGLGMGMTPSFVIAGAGLLGWPGAKALRSIVRNARLCGYPACEKK
jgi:hypothetical protein